MTSEDFIGSGKLFQFQTISFDPREILIYLPEASAGYTDLLNAGKLFEFQAIVPELGAVGAGAAALGLAGAALRQRLSDDD